MNIPDFVQGPLAWRSRHGGGRRQALARACGLKRGRPLPRILDCTAGLGRDAFALERALQDPATQESLGDRLCFQHGDALALLPDLVKSTRPNVLYLDPMHPHRQRSALTRLPLRELRALVGEDPDAGQLTQLACQQAVPRVVVKRPTGADPLWGKPSTSIPGRTTRFDLYFPG